ncbi:MAG: hypothetical protein A3E37_03240 [Candidatus Andersenbacteria bacterium RIFCSPHIGHO2_12_FULL_46_9]|nr:MAG: dTDP-4-dehydrorhamnose 3,5-epimerase-like protein enzyme [Parcubacteria group bacterium GW2011_GWA2_45_14]OGY33802.1 MAG: hypothetical protein A3B76_02985 [Candidatus Andersenbacteria bacterium RIFCSPHIGHO2_02_FULL_46_16]OGY36237.1 MAG: hypothetical protein A3I08_05305 [Candidatus Andersenbacteria bacterium RIFCSPLOWO2_02_FULL_46_11]OGY36678.1 MAG: hypothetical protein A3E37_03240 [Candidatus Andersenbacteria bacterium RIFCSPHIGHO2_12_FULL_46_9]OGY42739.1 MAG: hypothetical protein A3G57
MIEGVIYKTLKKIPDDRGVVWQLMKKSDESYSQFGEIYFTSLYHGVIKAWHKHKQMDLNYACITGAVKVVLYDGREKSSTGGQIEEYYLSTDCYGLLHIPHGVTNGMIGLCQQLSIVANLATLEHDPTEMERFDLSVIEYNW